MLDPKQLVETGGLLLIALMIFAESGMMVGFFFPGDTLLLSAGIFASQGKISLIGIIIVASLAAVAGDNTGYTIGKHAGHRIFRKKDGLLFRHKYIEDSERFFERYGSKTMLIAHFVPIARTFVPIVAGVGHMPRIRFALFDAIGDCTWALIVTLIGYWVGGRIPNIDHYILLAVAGATLLTFGPMAYHLLKALIEKKRTDSHKESK